MWTFDSIKFNKNTLTSEEIKIEPPESPLNNDDTLCNTDFDSESHLIGAAGIKEEIETNYVTRNGESETSQLDSKIKIEFEETDLKKECINEINETSDIESLKSNSKDFENIFVQSNQEHVIKEEENQELIADPLQEVAEGKADEERGHFEFIGINHSMCSEEKLNNLDIKVDSASHVLIHSEKEIHLGKNPLNNELNTQILIHTGEKSHKCDICGKLFRKKGVLKRHFLIHTGEKPQRCDICGKSFNDKTNLKRHQLIHTGEKPHKCDICGKLFSQGSSLNTHKFIHTGEKPYECDTCGKLFSQKKDLKRHYLVHTKEKPHKCDTCGKLFTLLSNLKTHKLIHTGEQPHKCDICGKLFSQTRSFNTHKMIHTGEKPYKCDICEKSFNQLGNLNKHKLIHIDIHT